VTYRNHGKKSNSKPKEVYVRLPTAGGLRVRSSSTRPRERFTCGGGERSVRKKKKVGTGGRRREQNSRHGKGFY